MPSNEIVLIDSFIAAAQAERDHPLADDVAFELFAAQTVLREYNLSDDELEEGRVGGGKDGGLDGVYAFLDGELLNEDSTLFADDFSAKSIRKGADLVLHTLQAKRETSFTETAIDKAHSSLSRFLDLTKSDEDLLKYYSPEIISRMRIFTNAWKKLGVRAPSIDLHFSYVTKGDVTSINEAVEQKGKDLEAALEALVPGSQTTVRYIGAKEAWLIASSAPEYDLQLKFKDYLSKGRSYTGLVSLSDYFDFLSDDNGDLRSHLFDWNVRDFQGGVTVNREIQSTLDSQVDSDFWWFNNGVTILCSNVNIGGDKTFTLEDVQIVNGMQTSHSIHDAISRIGADIESSRDRSVLVRVFETQNEETRDRIIRATNSQTKVPDASLHATEDIHRQIEAYFGSKGWFYDRRKNYYKNVGKPSDRIVSIPFLGQAVMAIGLGRPNDARARPSSLLNNGGDYRSLFNPDISLPIYLWLAKVQRQVDTALATLLSSDPYLRTNFKFYVSAYIVAKRYGKRVHSPKQLKALAGKPLSITTAEIEQALAEIQYQAEIISEEEDWAYDRVAKSRRFAESVLDAATGAA